MPDVYSWAVDMKENGMARQVAGTFPLESDGWRRMAIIPDAGGKEWHVFFRGADPEWDQWKVAAKGRADCKANYWFSFRRAKPGAHPRYELLREHHPEVFDAVEEIRAQVTGADDLL